MRAGVALFLLLAVCCVPEAPLDGLPCPCPRGYTCCELTDVCRAEPAACPSSYPPSSLAQCNYDADCGDDEVCPTWTHAATAGVLGPGRCRHRCEVTRACAAGEVCAPTPHDANPIEQFGFVMACLPEAQAEACRTLDCRSCPVDKIGGHYCGEEGVHACFFALDPECGIACQEVVIEPCDPSLCVVQESGPTCVSSAVYDHCVSFPCAPCPADPTATPFCHESSVASCLHLQAEVLYCLELCQVVEIERCDRGCVEDQVAACAD